MAAVLKGIGVAEQNSILWLEEALVIRKGRGEEGRIRGIEKTKKNKKGG